MTSCAALVLPSFELAQPFTHLPVDRLSDPWRVVVIQGDKAWIQESADPWQVPPPPPGASFLVPPNRTKEIQRYLTDHDDRLRKTWFWVLKVECIDDSRQRIELRSQGDGFRGGVYEATATTARPLYRKLTGPGFAWVAEVLALLINSLLWIVGYWIVGWLRSWIVPPGRERPR